jgi:hypothetical protein
MHGSAIFVRGIADIEKVGRADAHRTARQDFEPGIDHHAGRFEIADPASDGRLGRPRAGGERKANNQKDSKPAHSGYSS